VKTKNTRFPGPVAAALLTGLLCCYDKFFIQSLASFSLGAGDSAMFAADMSLKDRDGAFTPLRIVVPSP